VEKLALACPSFVSGARVEEKIASKLPSSETHAGNLQCPHWAYGGRLGFVPLSASSAEQNGKRRLQTNTLNSGRLWRPQVDSLLRFRPDGTFKIAQVADLHYGEGETEA
jgi:hypothetical protein